jgi:hypothetical protein
MPAELHRDRLAHPCPHQIADRRRRKSWRMRPERPTRLVRRRRAAAASRASRRTEMSGPSHSSTGAHPGAPRRPEVYSVPGQRENLAPGPPAREIREGDDVLRGLRPELRTDLLEVGPLVKPQACVVHRDDGKQWVSTRVNKGIVLVRATLEPRH